MPAAQPKTKVVPSSAVAGHPERPSSAASYNSWVRENVTDNTKIEDHERTSTPVQFLSPNASSVVSLREAGDVKEDEPAEPPPSRRSRPATPILDRPVSPKSVRSASPSLSHRLKTNAVVPTDAELPVQEPKELKKPEPVEAWSDVSDGDSKNGDAKETRAKSAGRSRSNPPNDSPGEGAHTGSAANMHSVISVREAAQDQRLDGMSVSGRLTPTQVKHSSTSPGGSKRNEDSRSVVSRTSGQIAPPQPAKQQQAYIPYMCARDTISKVVEDMQTMKNNHVDIVQKIQDAYKKIENETQSQFNIFVLGLRTQYKEKVKTFRQVIVVHQQELDSLKNYWESTITSLSQKNKELMKEKRKLLLINKTDIEKLQTEKDNLMTELTSKLDEEGHSYSERIKQLQETEKSLEDEKKILEDKLASEKDTVKEREREIEQLRAQLNETGTAPIVMAPGTDSEVNRENSVLTHQAGPSALVVAGLSAAERDRIIAEKDQFQDKMIEAQKELVIMQAKYANLENQYRSVAAMAKNDEESITAQMDVVKNDVNILTEEKDNLTEEIKKWKEDYKERTGEEPTEEDRPESIKELYTQLDEVETQKSKLDAHLTALSDLKEGNIPEPEEIVVPEPIIKTVEVTVADPSVLAELEVSQARNEQLEKEIQSLKDQMNEAQKSLKKVEKENKKLRSGTIEGAQSKDNANAVLVLQALMHQMNTSEGVNQQDKTELESQVQQAREEKQQVEAKQLELKEKLDLWAQQFEETNGRAPEKNDRDEEVEKLYQGLKEANEKTVSLEAQIMAHSMILTGEMPENFDKVSTSQVTAGGDGNSEELNELRERLQELEEEVEELTEKNNRLENTLEEMEEKKQSLEERIDELQSGVGVPVVEGTTPVGVSSASSIPSFDYYDEDDVEGLGAQINLLRQQQDDLEKQLEKEREAHEETKEELEELKQQLEQAKEDEASAARDSDGKAKASSAALLAEMALQTKSLEEAKQRIDELENEKLKDVPADSADEIRKLREKVKASEAEKDEAQKLHIQKTAEVDKLKVDMETTQKSLAKERETNRGHQETMKKKLAEKDKQAKEMVANAEQKFVAKEEEKNKQIKTLEKKLKEAKLSGAAVGAAAGAAKGGNKVDAKTEKKIAMMQEHINNLKKQVEQDKNTIKQLEKDVKEAKAGNSADKQAGKKTEKQLKDLEKKLENETKKFEREQKKANELETQLKAATKERDSNADEIKKLQAQIDSLGVAATEALELKEKVGAMTAELKELKTENKTLTENYNSERVLRKKYYNMVEDMKGKIRVYCRARPLSGSEKDRGNYEIVKAPDEYSINVESNRGNKEFQFDHIFMPDSSQEDVFEDTNNLIQSAVDGYNVCIFAYGQTGSGKTFTMIGDKGQNFPGIAPRAFKKIFEVIEENKSKFTFKVYTYMCELYNDKLIDLYSKDHKDDARLDIKKDKKGMVFIQGAVIQEATNSKELNGLFEQGSENRHVASTNMNSESSRSHLILAIIIESTNLSTGSVTKGKLSLVDLAGSERAAKTGATAAQLKEANSINKSLSALGDVIAALSSEQQFIPYRNNKLTMLMQDSLGGNAKTLMFVNISPADYNAEETIISLTYASRVKLITNDASKNADNKEIARLKSIIAKLKSGETVGDEEVDGTDD
ncbi:Kinesin-like protein KIN-14I [Holothuria leucospilota]|uniref:Kinesin-like protein KIN-14I n=1 Tax=Holothuria leucospilota TaxID=206669 RepID=A0A9Q1GZD2_HOLLE|nr:Kinesin-like protein KIN-14I [Holothuria leucospilota]